MSIQETAYRGLGVVGVTRSSRYLRAPVHVRHQDFDLMARLAHPLERAALSSVYNTPRGAQRTTRRVACNVQHDTCLHSSS
jgi:hypothetical protein